jgi:hypothetical protein
VREKELPGLQPSPEAVAWGKRMASESPRWSETKWTKIGILLGVQLATSPKSDQTVADHPTPPPAGEHIDAETWRDAA